MKRIAIIGAGIAGLTCARELRRAGHAVRVYDKGRSPGGRTSTRRSGTTIFNHGAPWIEAVDPDFRDDLVEAVGVGVLRQLRPDLVVLDRGRVIRQLDNRWIFAGRPTMNRYAHHLAADIPVSPGLPVTALARHTGPDGNDRWEVRRGEWAAPEQYDAVVLALPAPQAGDLLPAGSIWVERLARVGMDPVLTAMMAPLDPWDPGWDAAQVNGGDLDRIIRVRAPGPASPLADEPAPESWVVHASTTYSRRRLEDDPGLVAEDLATALARELGRPLPRIRHLSGHRWRYARTSRPLGDDFLLDPTLGLGVCGDWCRGDRVEDAWISGRSLALGMLEELGPAEPAPARTAWGVVH